MILNFCKISEIILKSYQPYRHHFHVTQGMIHTHTIYFIVICNVAFTLISISCCTSVISFMHLHWCYSFSTYPFVISFVTACAILPSTDYGTVGKSMGSLLAPHVLGCLTLKKKKKCLLKVDSVTGFRKYITHNTNQCCDAGIGSELVIAAVP